MCVQRQLCEQQVLQTNVQLLLFPFSIVAENKLLFTNKQTIKNKDSHACSGLIALYELIEMRSMQFPEAITWILLIRLVHTSERAQSYAHKSLSLQTNTKYHQCK